MICATSGSNDSVLIRQEFPKGNRQGLGQFLPREHLTPGTKICRPHRGHNRVQVLVQIRPTGINQRAEIEIEMVSGKDIAYELIGRVFLARSRELTAVEDLQQVPITLNEFRTLQLKIRFCQLRFKNRASELHVNLRSLDRSTEQRDARPETEFRTATEFNPQKAAQLSSFGNAGIAEDVHQERIGTQ